MKVGLVLLIGFAQAAFAQSVGQDALASPEEALRTAETAYEHQQFNQAEQMLNSILRRFPSMYEPNEMMALVLTAKGRDEAANRFFKIAAEVQPNSVTARGNLAANFASLHQNARAEQEFRQTLRIDPTSYDLNHNFGEFYISLGKISDAIPLLKAAQATRPDAYSNGYDLALAELKNNQLSDAEMQVKTLLKMQTTAELHALLGDVYEKEGQFVAAAGELQCAAQLDPTEDNLFDWAAELLRHQTNDAAIEVFTHAVERFPKSWRMQLGLGAALYVQGYSDRASEALSRAIDLDPKDPRAYFLLSRIANVPPAMCGQIIDRFERYVTAEPRDPRAPYYYALVLLNANGQSVEGPQAAKIEALLERALALEPKFADAHLQLGILYSQQERYPDAIRQYKRALELNPSLALAHYRLARAMTHSGDKEGGRRELEVWQRQRAHDEQEQEKQQRQMLRFIYVGGQVK